MLYFDKMTKIYLDACCLNRPFDDQNQARIRLETEAIILILERLHQREWVWISSEVLFFELKQTVDIERRERLLLLARQSHQVVELTQETMTQAEKLAALGFDSYDALHLACAQQSNVDVFLTTDDELLKVVRQNKESLPFLAANPLRWLQDMLK